MAVITFSRKFPSYHSERGKPTYFVEKILNQLNVGYNEYYYLQKLIVLNKKNIRLGKLSFEDIETFFISLQDVQGCKSHTIRGGNRFKEGEIFSPRVWSGKPYKSPQIIFWDDIEIKKVWEYKVVVYDSKGLDNGEKWFINGTNVSESNNYMKSWWNHGLIKEIAKNDGLTIENFLEWFRHPSDFTGSIICWNKKVNY